MGQGTDRLWNIIIITLLASTLCGGIILVVKFSTNRPTEIIISSPPTAIRSGQIHIGGAVTSPGFYPWKETDTIPILLEGAGPGAEADLNHLKFYVPGKNETRAPQKIDLNRAEAWLLEALPDIGATRAQAIINYRNKNGGFQRAEDLLKIEGIGRTTYEKIKGLVSVED